MKKDNRITFECKIEDSIKSLTEPKAEKLEALQCMVLEVRASITASNQNMLRIEARINELKKLIEDGFNGLV